MSNARVEVFNRRGYLLHFTRNFRSKIAIVEEGAKLYGGESVSENFEQGGNVQVRRHDTQGATLPDTVCLRNNSAVGASNLDVPLEVRVQEVELARKTLRQARFVQ